MKGTEKLRVLPAEGESAQKLLVPRRATTSCKKDYLSKKTFLSCRSYDNTIYDKTIYVINKNFVVDKIMLRNFKIIKLY